jgi:hypothetical protein
MTSLAIAVLLTIVMLLLATTPRARENVMLVSMTAFSLTVLWRSRSKGQKAPDGTSLSLILIAPAAALLAWGGSGLPLFPQRRVRASVPGQRVPP